MTQRHIWKHDGSPRFSNDLAQFRHQLHQQVERWQLTATTLGKVAGEPLMLYRSADKRADLPHKLVVAGFHGEEPAGVWGVLAFLQQQQPENFQHIALTILPLINTRGFSQGQRSNSQGKDANRGYAHPQHRTKEGGILIQHADLLLGAARDGALTCHEDVLSHQAYLYSYEQHAKPGDFTLGLRQVLAEHFPLVTSEMADGYRCHNGIIFNQADDSFESWLFSQGIATVACSETPGRCDFAQRIMANAAMIAQFLHPVLSTQG